MRKAYIKSKKIEDTETVEPTEYSSDESISSIVFGISRRYKTVDPYECVYEEEPENIFVEYSQVKKNDTVCKKVKKEPINN